MTVRARAKRIACETPVEEGRSRRRSKRGSKDSLVQPYLQRGSTSDCVLKLMLTHMAKDTRYDTRDLFDAVLRNKGIAKKQLTEFLRNAQEVVLKSFGVYRRKKGSANIIMVSSEQRTYVKNDDLDLDNYERLSERGARSSRCGEASADEDDDNDDNGILAAGASSATDGHSDTDAAAAAAVECVTHVIACMCLVCFCLVHVCVPCVCVSTFVNTTNATQTQNVRD
jgi:hypothetical protein